MENLDISNVPNSVLIGAAIEDLYFCLSADGDRNYRFRKDIFEAVTGGDEAEFKKLFYGRGFHCLMNNVEVCDIAINHVEYMLKNDVESRLETLIETLKTAEKEEDASPEIEKLDRERFLLWVFNDDKKKFLNKIELIAKKINDPQKPNIHVCTVRLSGIDPFVISDSSVVSGFKDYGIYYVENNEKWAEIDKRLDALKRELSATATNGV